jgi:SAM-dependent methyltransferase/uncharacterized protein YbaR (Trm112 family)
LRLRHFQAIRPVCPVCRADTETAHPLSIAHVARESRGHIVEAILHCTNPGCQREYPVIDGIPLLLANLRQFVAENALRLLARRDLGPTMESLIGDCCGPGSDFDTVRQQVSAYTWEHWGEFDADAGGAYAEEAPGTMLAALAAGLELAGPAAAGAILDIGCGPGRAAFELAARTGEMVLGVDLHFPLLQVAQHALRDGSVCYDRRRVGVVYDRRAFAIPSSISADNVDFWACDAAALPFDPGIFSLVVGLNVLDSIYAPRELLHSLSAALREGGKAILTSPYDWSAGATPLEAWLGGHSQRSPSAGASEAVLRTLLTPGASPPGVPGLVLAAEQDGLPWRVRLHDRAAMSYRLHLLVATRQPPGPPRQ